MALICCECILDFGAHTDADLYLCCIFFQLKLYNMIVFRFPERVRHLILADPWGFPEKPTSNEFRVPVPLWIKAIAMMLQPFNPLAALRAAGPWGKYCLTVTTFNFHTP